MQLIEIFKKCKDLSIYDQRCVSDDFIELVFFNKDLPDWYNIITSVLGEPRKAQNCEPNDSDLKLTARTGGIRYEQTLFEKIFEEGTIIAKFWPWQDGSHTTLRVALLRS
jgi:hypothetical protein